MIQPWIQCAMSWRKRTLQLLLLALECIWRKINLQVKQRCDMTCHLYQMHPIQQHQHPKSNSSTSPIHSTTVSLPAKIVVPTEISSCKRVSRSTHKKRPANIDTDQLPPKKRNTSTKATPPLPSTTSLPECVARMQKVPLLQLRWILTMTLP